MTYANRRRFNPLYVLPVIGLVFAAGFVGQQLDGSKAQRQDLQRYTANAAVDLELEAARAEAEAQVAISRYQSGHCLLSGHELQPGMAIANVNPGQQICDRQGTTAITDENGILINFARTNDQTVVREFLGW